MWSNGLGNGRHSPGRPPPPDPGPQPGARRASTEVDPDRRSEPVDDSRRKTQFNGRDEVPGTHKATGPPPHGRLSRFITLSSLMIVRGSIRRRSTLKPENGKLIVNEVRIADLRDPQRTPDERAFYEFAVGIEVDMGVDGIVADARRSTGLRRLEDGTVLDRLAAQVAAVEADAGLSGLGRLIIRDRLVGLLKARLRSTTSSADIPRSADVELEPPVIVVGLPRSGTTHLVNLLAADSRFRSMPWWEVIEPIPVIGDGPGRDGVDPRYLRCLAAYEMTSTVAPLTVVMHDRPPWSIEEECELVDLDLCSYVARMARPGPGRWRDHYLGLDQREPLRVPSPGAAGARPTSGARIAGFSSPPSTSSSSDPCWRRSRLPPSPSRSAIPSPCCSRRSPCSPMVTVSAGWRSRPDELAGYWVDRIERLLRAAVRDAHLIADGRRVDVEFGVFMADDLGMATTILGAAGLEVHRPDPLRADGVPRRQPPGQGGPGRLRPSWRFRARSRRSLRPVRLLLRGVPSDREGGVLTMTGIHRKRPGADAIAPATGDPAIDLDHGIWLSPGLSNSYLLQTDDGRIVVNTGMGFEGPLHRRAYDAVDPSPTSAIVFTQGHFDHVGGIGQPARRGHRAHRPGELRHVAGGQRASGHVPVPQCRLRLDAGHPRRHGPTRESLGANATAQARPEPTTTFDDRLELSIGGRDLVLLSAPGGETTDSLVIWLPDHGDGAHRQPVRPPLRARPQPRDHPRRPLPRRPDLRRVARIDPRPRPSTGCSPATSTPSRALTGSPPRSWRCVTPCNGSTTLRLRA